MDGPVMFVITEFDCNCTLKMDVAASFWFRLLFRPDRTLRWQFQQCKPGKTQRIQEGKTECWQWVQWRAISRNQSRRMKISSSLFVTLVFSHKFLIFWTNFFFSNFFSHQLRRQQLISKWSNFAHVRTYLWYVDVYTGKQN